MNDQNHRVADATRYLITQIVPAFARELDAQADKLPISQPAESKHASEDGASPDQAHEVRRTSRVAVEE